MLENLYAAAIGFESGFTGFRGLTITSLVWVGRLIFDGAFIPRLFADALRIGEKKGKKYPFSYTPQVYHRFIL